MNANTNINVIQYILNSLQSILQVFLYENVNLICLPCGFNLFLCFHMIFWTIFKQVGGGGGDKTWNKICNGLNFFFFNYVDANIFQNFYPSALDEVKRGNLNYKPEYSHFIETVIGKCIIETLVFNKCKCERKTFFLKSWILIVILNVIYFCQRTL